MIASQPLSLVFSISAWNWPPAVPTQALSTYCRHLQSDSSGAIAAIPLLMRKSMRPNLASACCTRFSTFIQHNTSDSLSDQPYRGTRLHIQREPCAPAPHCGCRTQPCAQRLWGRGRRSRRPARSGSAPPPRSAAPHSYPQQAGYKTRKNVLDPWALGLPRSDDHRAAERREFVRDALADARAAARHDRLKDADTDSLLEVWRRATNAGNGTHHLAGKEPRAVDARSGRVADHGVALRGRSVKRACSRCRWYGYGLTEGAVNCQRRSWCC